MLPKLPKLSPRTHDKFANLDGLCVVAFVSGVLSLYPFNGLNMVAFVTSILALTGRCDPVGTNKKLAVAGLALSLISGFLLIVFALAVLFAVPYTLDQVG
jgi:hypothetical protein